MLSTCKKTEKPPIPSKNEVKIIFVEIAFIGIEAIKAMPFVISKNPVSVGATKLLGIWKKLKNGIEVNVNIFNRRLALNIDIITEKITTKPPIISRVEVAFEIDVASISPKLEKDIFGVKDILVSFLLELIFEDVEIDLYFQNLNKKPTVRQAKKCVINSKNPIEELPNILIPTVPIMNRGPGVICKTK